MGQQESVKDRWKRRAFMLTVAVMLVCSGLNAAGQMVATIDTLRFVAGDRPIYHLSTGPGGSARWLDWDLPAGGRGINVTYEVVTGQARRPAALHIGGDLPYRRGDGECPVRAAWDVSVAGNSIASGVLGSEGNVVNVRFKLPDPYVGLPIGISVRRVDSENCAARFAIDDLSINGDMPIPFRWYFSGRSRISEPDVLIIDECRNNKPCPEG